VFTWTQDDNRLADLEFAGESTPILNSLYFFYFFKGRKKDFGKVMEVFLWIIRPLAEAI
jgi:hypothetical protein